MKSSSRLLIGFGAGIAVLVIIAVVLVLTLGQGNSPLLPEDTPQGTVQRYLQAVQEKDYLTAYNFLAPPPATPDVTKPQQTFDSYVQSAQYASNNTWKATLGKTTENGNTASVEVVVEVFVASGPFGNPVRTNNITFFLTKEGTKWLITAPLDLYWLY